MLTEEKMNDENQENEAKNGPVILTIPASLSALAGSSAETFDRGAPQSWWLSHQTQHSLALRFAAIYAEYRTLHQFEVQHDDGISQPQEPRCLCGRSPEGLTECHVRDRQDFSRGGD